ncbi:MAG: hypothetical protein DRP27_07000 [Thermotogae bacterium]|nr:MAG: hypothetical protein DRP27_07000 [Thermotogota bacterium]
MKNIDKIGFFKENKEAKRRVLRALEETISSVLHQYDDVVSIILFGSLARKEGVWKREEGRLSIISDLDLLVITRKKRKLSKGLRRIVESIKEREGFEIDIRFICRDKLKGLIKDTHTFDEKEGITLWGEDITSEFPKFKEEDINIEDAIFLFFNRVILTLNSFPLSNIKSAHARRWLSHEASKTMFTCADLISIFYGKYFSSILERVKFAETKLKSLNIPDRKAILEDLKIAVNFRFKEVNKVSINNAYDYWARSREHLINIFTVLYTKSSRKGELRINEQELKSQLTSLYERKYNIKLKTTLYQVLKLLRSGNIPKLPGSITHYFVNCRMASLMLYVAVGKEGVRNDHVKKAEEYLSQVCFLPSKDKEDMKEKWKFLRDKLVELYEAYIF